MRKWIVLVSAMLLLLPAFFVPIQTSSAMLTCLTCCPNEYPDSFTSFLVSNGTKTVDPFHHSGSSIQLTLGNTYSVSFSLESGSQSLSGNTFHNGSVWVDTNVPGYYGGYCFGNGSQDWFPVVDNVGPNENVSVTLNNVSASYGVYPGGSQIQWSDYTINSTFYIVYLMIQTSTALSCAPVRGGDLCTASVSDLNDYGEYSNDYANGTVQFSSGGKIVGTCLLPAMSTDSCSSSFSTAGSQIVASYLGDISHLKSSATAPNPVVSSTTTRTVATTITSTVLITNTSTLVCSSSSCTATSIATVSATTGSQTSASGQSVSGVSSSSNPPPAPPPSPRLNNTSTYEFIGAIIAIAIIAGGTLIAFERRSRL